MRPLRKQGITDFKIRHKDKPTFEAKQDEVAYFDAPTEHEGETVSSSDTRLMIVAPSFQEGNKWRVNDGSRNIYVSMRDPTFVRTVQQGNEAFRKVDVLHVTPTVGVRAPTVRNRRGRNRRGQRNRRQRNRRGQSNHSF